MKSSSTNIDAHEYRGLKLTTYSGWVQGFWVVEGEKVGYYVKHKRIMNLL